MPDTNAPVREQVCPYCQHVHGPLGCDAKSCGCGGAREHPGWPDALYTCEECGAPIDPYSENFVCTTLCASCCEVLFVEAPHD